MKIAILPGDGIGPEVTAEAVAVLEPLAAQELTKTISLESKKEQRVDWRVKAAKEGTAVVRMKAITDADSDEAADVDGVMAEIKAALEEQEARLERLREEQEPD